jgi:hypothetical protein
VFHENPSSEGFFYCWQLPPCLLGRAGPWMTKIVSWVTQEGVHGQAVDPEIKL